MSPDTVRLRVADALAEGQPVRLDLTDDGRHGTVFADHAAPVLAVHRCLAAAIDDPALDPRAACAEAHRLVTTLPAYVLVSDPDAERAADTVRAAAEALAEAAGDVLVVEIWTPLDEADTSAVDPFDRAPGFTIFAAPGGPAPETLDALCDALSGIEIAGQGADVVQIACDAVAPPGLPPLALGVPTVGLAVDAVFLNARDGEFYPRVLDALRRAVAPAVVEAAAIETDTAPALVGRTSLEPAAETVDRGLSEVASSFGFLLHVTPVNPAEAWDAFRAARCDTEPEWLYRPLAFDPDDARRRLFALPIEEVEDPAVHALLRACRDEIDAHIRMILDVETPQFLPASLRVYGAPDDDLVDLARAVVGALDARPEATPAAEPRVGATAFAAQARAELEAYHARNAHVPVEVEVREDVSSLMVSHGRLLVSATTNLPERRVRALLAHEVGTHVLTYANGCAQPLEQLRHGTAGYQDLQEGLAVLGEWLVGGLTTGRFRTLAARVLGARALADGADFVDVFRVVRESGLSERAGFGVAMRLRRGGGLTKDMVYLRGLRDLLRHLAAGGSFWRLFVGKIALSQLPAIDDLRARGLLVDPPLRPSYADEPSALDRLDRARAGLSVLDLLRD